MLVCFELTMPNRASWNRRWSGENSRHLVIKKFLKKDQEIIDRILKTKNYFYRWDDGWRACITVELVDSKQTNKLKKLNSGFCGYDWMVESIIRFGEIRLQRD